MTIDDVTSLLTDVRRLRQRFASTAPHPWTATIAAAELTVQLGHVALCLLRRRGADTAEVDDLQRPIVDLGDEIADVLLAVLSVTTLAGTQPTASPRPSSTLGDDDVGTVLWLLVAAGHLAEAAMIAEGYRHQPGGRLPSVPTASGEAAAACAALAQRFGLDLVVEFRAMVADADAFLDGRDTLR